MKFEQAIILLEIARNAVSEIEGVYSVRTSIQTDEFVIHVTKKIFDTIPGDVVVNSVPDDVLSSFHLRKKNNGITFEALVEPKEFYELYPDYRKK